MNNYAIKRLNNFLHDEDSAIIFGLIILGVLFGLDIGTTEFILSNGGYEINILMRSVVSSEVIHLALKLSVLLLIAFVVFHSNSKLKNSGTMALLLIIIIYLITVINNLGSIYAIL